MEEERWVAPTYGHYSFPYINADGYGREQSERTVEFHREESE